MTQEHELKCHPKYLGRISEGTKTFEIRKNDRDYQVGDTLILRAYDEKLGWPDHGVYDTVVAKVVYFTTEFQQPGYCVLGIQVIDEKAQDEFLAGYPIRTPIPKRK